MTGEAISGWLPGVHLTSQGRLQAHRLAARLAPWPVAAVYSSPLERALETAAPLAAALNLAVQVSEALGELRYGEWTGAFIAELQDDPLWERFNTLRSCTRIPGGELLLEVQLRAVAELQSLRLRHPGQVVAVVSHGDVLKSVLGYYLGIPIDLLHRIEIAPASLTVLSLSDFGPRIERVNDVSQLEQVEPSLLAECGAQSPQAVTGRMRTP
jgi:probable phosphoglycerate mutase